ncbi:LacI family DNA-binding transcriptional regulator [Priestia filamentosa]|uniref:LacI family DNA-binding transcriptional regulator n=1 Tax=Priestia filamentosa TaxID=1402861 RepID=UPI000317939F|nr:LacI family DNA-binding transcriptional regulator [Priestia filamentosa]
MSNIRKIAELANVSITTVSRVLNNHPYVAEEKRKAVLDIIKQLNYTPNINAIHLAKGHTGIVGVVVPNMTLPYFSAVVDGISNKAMEHDYKLMIYQTKYEREKEIEALEMLKKKQVDGLIIISRKVEWSLIESYSEYGPILICEDRESKKISTISINHYEGFAIGMNYLREKGHKRVGCCLSRLEGSNSKRRIQAYYDFGEKFEMDVREQWIFKGCLFIEDGRRVIEQLKKMPESPTALLVASDYVAAGVMTSCNEYGVKVPTDLAFIGFDNHPLAEALHITTIEHPIVELGSRALAKIHSVLHEAEAPSQSQLPLKLIERKTV